MSDEATGTETETNIEVVTEGAQDLHIDDDESLKMTHIPQAATIELESERTATLDEKGAATKEAGIEVEVEKIAACRGET